MSDASEKMHSTSMKGPQQGIQKIVHSWLKFKRSVSYAFTSHIRMYALSKCGGNHFAFFAGDRSDFIMLRHPEFRLGRNGSECGFGKGWDTTPFPTGENPNASAPIKKLKASQRASSPRLRGHEPQKPPLKARALARSKSAPGTVAKKADSSLDNFVQELTAAGSLPAVYKNPHSIQQLSHTTKHFMEKRDQLAELRDVLLRSRDPASIKQKLQEGSAWRHHARALQEVKSRASKKELVPDNLHPPKDTLPTGIGRYNYKHPPPVPASEYSTMRWSAC